MDHSYSNGSSKNDPKISVIIPYYNGWKYMEACLQSVFAQTLPPLETIVVNDGSDEESSDFINKLSYKYPIKLFRKENGGQSSARNLGVQMSAGNLIAFLDQDDVWYPNHLEELNKPFLEPSYPELGWVYSNMDLIGGNGELIFLHYLSQDPGNHPKESLGQCLAQNMLIAPSSALISKKAFDAVGGFDERLSGYEDDDLFLRLFSKAYGHIFLNKSLHQWRVHHESCVRSPRMINSAMIYAKKLIENYPRDILTGRDYMLDAILPRFLNVLVVDYRRGLQTGDTVLAKSMSENIQAFYPYMPPRYISLTRLILFLSRHNILKCLVKPFFVILLKFLPKHNQLEHLLFKILRS